MIDDRHRFRLLPNAILMLLAAAVLATPNAVRAQADDVRGWCEWDHDPAHPLAWNNLRGTVAPLVDDDEFRDAYAAVAARYEELIRDLPQGSFGSTATTAREAVDAYMHRISEPGREAPETWVPFEDAETGSLLYSLGPFHDDDDERELSISCSVFDPDNPGNIEEMTAYLFRAMRRVGEYGNELVAGQLGATAVAERAYSTYENWVFNGLPMWPWELWANGLRIPEDPAEAVPRTQFVFLRPGFSPVFHFDGERDSELDIGLVVEPVGFVRYTSRDYREWWGASFLVSMTENNGVGYGAQFRWNEYTLGVAHHARSNDELLYVGVDLYQLVMGDDRKSGSAEAFLEAVKQRLRDRAEGL